MTESKPEYFYKYVTAETALAILYNGSVRFSSPRLFNDPFDIQFDRLFPHTKKQALKIAKVSLRNLAIEVRSRPLRVANPDRLAMKHLCFLLKESPQMKPDEIVQNMIPTMNSLFEELDDTISNYIKESTQKLENACVFCLSEMQDSLLMWAHYADSHKGAVIKFKSIPDENLYQHATQVDYTEDTPTYALLKSTVDFMLGISRFDTMLIRKILTSSKSKEWKYEKEWRVVLRFMDEVERAVGYMDEPIHPEEVDEIILGFRMPKKDRENLTMLIAERYSHARVIQARKHSQKYGLSFRTVRQGTDKATA